MAHYALLDENNIVVQVIPGRDENEIVDGITDWETHYAEVSGLKCKRTSYNTLSGKHVFDGTPYRINYAGIGMIYDEDLDGFIPQKPFASWLLNTTEGQWYAPVDHPINNKNYRWNEETLSWIEIQE
jgi:hypothetical protein